MNGLTRFPLSLPTAVVVHRAIEVVAAAFDSASGRVVVASVYAPPTGVLGRVLEELRRAIRGADVVVIGGDFNGKHESWGGELTDARGEELNAWAVVNRMDVLNDPESLPTFESTNGRSWVDVTLLSGAAVMSWTVSDEETLSDHRAIVFTVQLEIAGDGTDNGRAVYNVTRANWAKFYRFADVGLRRRDVTAVEMQATVEGACEAAMRRTRGRHGARSCGWWTAELGAARSSVRRLRREYQAAGGEERDRRKNLFRVARHGYKRLIASTKIQSFRRYCDTEGENAWGPLYKIVRGRIGGGGVWEATAPGASCRGDVAETLLQQYFPDDDEAEDTVEHARVRRTVERSLAASAARVSEWDVPGVHQQELSGVANGFHPRKAPGPDGVPPGVLRKVSERYANEWCTLLDGLLARGEFPRVWKRARIVWLAKPARGFRPIGLLSVLGKVLDKLIYWHPQEWCEDRRTFSEHQYGFRRGKTTVMGTVNRGAIDSVGVPGVSLHPGLGFPATVRSNRRGACAC